MPEPHQLWSPPVADWPYNTSQWRRLRVAKLRETPLCEYCTPGRERLANQVDHRVPVKEGGDPWAWDNLASCCQSCHSRKTASEDGAFGNKKGKGKPLRGCDANGRPIDRRHWWNGKSLAAEAIDRVGPQTQS